MSNSGSSRIRLKLSRLIDVWLKFRLKDLGTFALWANEFSLNEKDHSILKYKVMKHA